MLRIIVTLLVFVPILAFGQLPSGSDLPIVVINTDGAAPIIDDPRVNADMGIIYNGPAIRNYLTDPWNDYDGRISIEIRGSTSQQYPKKSYGFETQDPFGNNNNVSLLGMGVENDWILYAPYPDKTMIRNSFTYSTFAKMGHWSPQTRYCELVVNGNYRGVYMLLEKIKIDNDRVDIANLTPFDVSGDQLTGGYIMKVDKGTGSGTDSIISAYDPKVIFQFHDPADDELMPVQKSYIEQYIRDFEDALDAPTFADPVIGYKPFIDRRSFIDFWLMQELGRTVDGLRSSSFFFKDKDSKGGKLTFGPMWDFNLSYGNADYCDSYLIAGWQKDFNSACPWFSTHVPFWWDKLLQDPIYANEARCRWEELRKDILATSTIHDIIDSTVLVLAESRVRNFAQWPIIGSYVNWNFYVGATYMDDVNHFKTWTQDRAAWMDANIPGTCVCTTVADFSLSDSTVCAGDTIFVTNNTADEINYVWRLNGVVTTPTAPDTFVLSAGSYTLDIKAEGQGWGCFDSSYVHMIDVDGTPPVADAGADMLLTCAAPTTNMDGTGSDPGMDYNWTATGTGNIASGGTTTTPTVDAPGTYIIEVTDPSSGCSATASADVTNDVGLPIAHAGPDLSLTCLVSSVDILGSSSSSGPGITYNWTYTAGGNITAGATTNSPTVDAPGTYTLTVTNTGNSCSAVSNVVVTLDNTPPVADAGLDTVLACATPSLDLDGTGSDAGKTYSWTASNGGNITAGAFTTIPTVNAAGTYVLSVMDQVTGCSAIDTVIVGTDTILPVADAGTGGVLDCFTPDMVLDGSGSTAGLNYSWTTTAGNITAGATTLAPTVDAAGTYTLQVTDPGTGCMAYDNVVVTELPGLTGNLTDLNATVCPGECVGAGAYTVTNGVGPYDYQWFDGLLNPIGTNASSINTVCGGVYSVEVTDNGTGCTTVRASIINEFAVLPPVMSPLKPSYCSQDNHQYPIAASPPGGTLSGNGITGSDFIPSDAGVGTHTIEYAYTDVNNCTVSTDQDVDVEDCTGIDESANDETVKVFPNPASVSITIQTERARKGTYRLLNDLGEIVLEGTYKGKMLELNVSKLTKGRYSLDMELDSGKVHKHVVIM